MVIRRASTAMVGSAFSVAVTLGTDSSGSAARLEGMGLARSAQAGHAWPRTLLLVEEDYSCQDVRGVVGFSWRLEFCGRETRWWVFPR